MKVNTRPEPLAEAEEIASRYLAAYLLSVRRAAGLKYRHWVNCHP